VERQMKQQVKISQVKTNPKNPRIIKDHKFKKLVQSIKDFPEMLEKRPIVVDENMIVLGGNMRLKACLEAGLKEVWIDRSELDRRTKARVYHKRQRRIRGMGLGNIGQ
jgi:hypothetical protein